MNICHLSGPFKYALPHFKIVVWCIAAITCSVFLSVPLSEAETEVELNDKFSCVVSETGEKNDTIINTKTLKEVALAKYIKRLKKKIKKSNTPVATRKKLKALVKKLTQCKNQKGDFDPDSLKPNKTGTAYAKATLVATGTSVAAKCRLIIPDVSTQLRAATGGSIYCTLGAVVTAGSGAFFLFGETGQISQSLKSVTFIPNNGQFNTFSTDLDAATAQEAVDYLRGSKKNLSGNLIYSVSGQEFSHYGVFEEASSDGDCRLQASIIGQGNSGQVFLDLADGSISVSLGNEVSALTTLNIFAGSTSNSPTVGQFAIPQSIIDILPQSEFTFALSTTDLVKVVDAVTSISETLTVSIPQSPVDNTLVGTFTTPQLDCPATQ